jgi:hypothetical protein
MVLSSVVVSCDANSGCNDLGCVNGVFVSAAPESGLWTAGEYELEVTHDDETVQCSFTLPKDLPTASITTLIDCGETVHANLYASGGCSQSCGLSSSFELNVSINAKPTSFGVRLSRDGEVLLDDSREVEYDDVYPDGAECGVGCQQARYDLVVEPAAEPETEEP